MYRCHRNADADEEFDETAIVDFISSHLIKKFRGCKYSAETVRQIMSHVTEAVVEKYEEQKKLPLADADTNHCG